MTKYVPIWSILPHIPGPVKQQMDRLEILRNAFLAIRNLRLQFKYTSQVEQVEIKSHKAVLPMDLTKLTDVFYTEQTNLFEKYQVKDIGDNRLLYYQQMFFDNILANNDHFKPLFYLGQGKADWIDQKLYCNECAYGFSVDPTLQCMTTDLPDGSVYLVYDTPVKVDGEYAIPDDAAIHMGLAAFVIARYWEEKTFSHEANAPDLMLQYDQKAVNLLQEYRRSYILSNVNPLRRMQFILNRNLRPNR